MSVLITGGGGFVGLNIAEALLAQNESVVLFGVSMPPEALLQRLMRHENLHCVIGDVCNVRSVSEVMIRYNVDRVVHGAAITAALEREAREAVRIVEVNLIGTINVLEASIESGVRRVIQLGSGSVYGRQVKTEGRLDEDLDPAVPDSIYGITKLSAERVALRYRDTRGLDVAVARLGVVFGPWEYDTGLRDTLSIPHVLLELAQKAQEARIMHRVPTDWVHAADVATAIVKMLHAERLDHGLYHVSGGMQWDIHSWCRALQERHPGFSWRFVEDAADANVGRLSPVPRPPFSVDRIMNELHWQPRYLGADALLHMLRWHGHRPTN